MVRGARRGGRLDRPPPGRLGAGGDRLLAWRFWREEGATDPNTRIEPGGGDPEPEELVRSGRAGFMALFGLAANALFLLMIVYGGVSLLLLRPCLRT